MTVNAIILDNEETDQSTVIIERGANEVGRITVPTEQVEVDSAIVRINDGSGKQYHCDLIERGWDTGTITSLVVIHMEEEA